MIKVFIIYSFDPLSLKRLNPDEDDILRKCRVEYEKARIINLKNSLMENKYEVEVDIAYTHDNALVVPGKKAENWAEERMKACDYLLLVLTESFYRYLCQQVTWEFIQPNLPKLKNLLKFLQERSNNSLVISFTTVTGENIPTVLEELDLFDLKDSPTLKLQKNYENIVSKLRSGYQEIDQKLSLDNSIIPTHDLDLDTIGEVEVDQVKLSKIKQSGDSDKDVVGPMTTQKTPKRLQLKLSHQFHNTEIFNLTAHKKLSYDHNTPMASLGIMRTDQIEVAGKVTIDLAYKDIGTLPPDLPHHVGLEVLWASNNRIKELESIKMANLKSLEELYLHHNQIVSFPAALCSNLNYLRILWLSYNSLEMLPTDFFYLASLEHLHLESNLFKEFPMSILTLPLLKVLYLNHNQLESIPSEIEKMRTIERLYFKDNYLSTLPLEICSLPKLKKLNLLVNNFHVLPEVLRNEQLYQRIHIEISSRIDTSIKNPRFSHDILCDSKNIHTSITEDNLMKNTKQFKRTSK